MLEALNPLLDDTPPPKSPSTPGTCVDYIRKQLFFDRAGVGFETFMSALNSQSFLSDAINPNGQDIFRDAEEEIVTKLRQYLNDSVDVALKCNLTNPIELFVERVNWDKDIVITFNYDLLLEKVLEKKQIKPTNEIIHLHGSLAEQYLVYPNSRKFTGAVEKEHFSKRWKDAFDYLRDKKDSVPVSEWIFIGYSMTTTDTEAMGL
ncbi:MAG: SIR2 family protein, partial [Gallionellaceae bacterium]|nr:SIR2 family protein [Gallionellaceae bacterium]